MNGFLDPNQFLGGGPGMAKPGSFGSAFGSGHTAGTRGTPVREQQNMLLANPNSSPLQDNNPFLANPNSRPVGDPARREQRIMDARSGGQQIDPAMFQQLMQHPMFQQLMQFFLQPR